MRSSGNRFEPEASSRNSRVQVLSHLECSTGRYSSMCAPRRTRYNRRMSPERIPLIQARGLTKRFEKFTAVDGIDFDVWPGETFGFLGPNGAGKTSTMRMIGCTSPATSGDLRVMGMNPAKQAGHIKARLGVVPQQDNLDIELTLRENLLMYARYFDVPRNIAVK